MKSQMKLNKVQCQAIVLMGEALHDVKRYANDKHIVVGNTVGDHVLGIGSLVDLFTADKELRENLLMRAMLHDAGELAGEVSTVTNDLLGLGLPKDVKNEYETLIFNIYAHFAILAIQDRRIERFTDTLGVMRGIMRGPVSTDHTLMSTVIDYLKQSYKYMVKHSDGFKLEDLYQEAINYDSYEGRIFKALDVLEGNVFWNNNAVLTKEVSREVVSGYIHKVETIINGLGDTQIEVALKTSLTEALSNFKGLTNED